MPNLATSRAIVWRRLAALRRRVAPRPRPGAAAAPVAPGAARATAGGPAATPTPLVVDYFGRDGSTALLRLLSSSPDVHVEGRYPYEAEDLKAVLATNDPAAAWRELCAARFGSGAAPRWFAEKMIDARKADLAPFPQARVIALLRDPRDTWVSVEAFSRAVGAGEIGGSGTRAERLERFVERQRERLAWIETFAGEEGPLVVRYERLVDDLSAVAAEVGGWLGVGLDPAGVSGDFRLRWVHGTSRDPASSVGRWRDELGAPDLAVLRAGLEEPMRRAGYAGW